MLLNEFLKFQSLTVLNSFCLVGFNHIKKYMLHFFTVILKPFYFYFFLGLAYILNNFFYRLFGREDTDMRQELAPPLPSPPPPPIISPLSEVDENKEERSWAKYKQGKPDIYKSLHRHSGREESFEPYRRNRQQQVDRLGRPLLYHRSPHGQSFILFLLFSVITLAVNNNYKYFHYHSKVF